MKTFKIVGDDISDGYHTFDEIYYHRKLLYVNLCLSNAEDCVFADHKDWDSLVLVYNSLAGQISYHIDYGMLPLIKGRIKEVIFGDHKWDGHSPGDVLDRLSLLAKLNREEK
jgi:hypothetical protein